MFCMTISMHSSFEKKRKLTVVCVCLCMCVCVCVCVCVGVEGGFQVDEKKFVFEEELAVVMLPQWYEVKLPNIELPEVVSDNVFTAVLCDTLFFTEQSAKQADVITHLKHQQMSFHMCVRFFCFVLF